MKKTVLIVDDLAFVRMMIRDIVTRYGYEVIAEASNGLEAIQMYQRYHPDVVLLDITMPILNGIEALKRIMQMDKNANVIMCSALGQQKLIVNSIKYGAKDFVVKPFKEERLISAIQKVLKTRK